MTATNLTFFEQTLVSAAKGEAEGESKGAGKGARKGAAVIDACQTVDPAVNALANDVIGRVADKWTMIILETLDEHKTLRFTQLGHLVGGISQKMLTQTLRQMERDGLVTRVVYPVVPPKVEYSLTELGISLGAAFCGVWLWAEENLAKIEAARLNFDSRA